MLGSLGMKGRAMDFLGKSSRRYSAASHPRPRTSGDMRKATGAGPAMAARSRDAKHPCKRISRKSSEKVQVNRPGTLAVFVDGSLYCDAPERELVGASRRPFDCRIDTNSLHLSFEFARSDTRLSLYTSLDQSGLRTLGGRLGCFRPPEQAWKLCFKMKPPIPENFSRLRQMNFPTQQIHA